MFRVMASPDCPGLWHPRMADIFSAKIRDLANRPPSQQRVGSPVAEGQTQAMQAYFVCELNSAQLPRTPIILSEYKGIQSSQVLSRGLPVSGDSRTER